MPDRSHRDEWAASRRRRYGAEETLALVARIRGGDALATEVLAERYVGELRAWAETRLSHDAAPQNVNRVRAAIQSVLVGLTERVIPREASLVVACRDAIRERLEHGASPSILEETVGHPASQAYEAGLARLEPIEREAIVCRLELRRSFEQLALDLAVSDPGTAQGIFRRAFLHLAEEMSHGV
jgi:hypothetical protein